MQEAWETEKVAQKLKQGPPGFMVSKQSYARGRKVFDDHQKALFLDALYDYSTSGEYIETTDELVNMALDTAVPFAEAGFEAWKNNQIKAARGNAAKQQRKTESDANNTETRQQKAQHAPASTHMETALAQTQDHLTEDEYRDFVIAVGRIGLLSIISPSEQKEVEQDKLLYWLNFHSKEEVLKTIKSAYDKYQGGGIKGSIIGYITTCLKNSDGIDYEEGKRIRSN